LVTTVAQYGWLILLVNIPGQYYWSINSGQYSWLISLVNIIMSILLVNITGQ
jgi:hypothetical protein